MKKNGKGKFKNDLGSTGRRTNYTNDGAKTIISAKEQKYLDQANRQSILKAKYDEMNESKKTDRACD